MKEFEKWNTYQAMHSGFRDSSLKQYTAYVEEEREMAWREALEWVLDLWWHKSNDPELFRELLEDELGDE